MPMMMILMIMIMSMIIVDDFDDVDVNLEDGTWSAWRPMASISSYEQSVEDEVKHDHIIFSANCDFKHDVDCNRYQPG